VVHRAYSQQPIRFCCSIAVRRNIENQRTLKTLGRYSESPDEIIIQLVGDDYRCLGSAQEVSRENEQTKIWEALDQAEVLVWMQSPQKQIFVRQQFVAV
jgi:hypothetical protein